MSETVWITLEDRKFQGVYGEPPPKADTYSRVLQRPVATAKCLLGSCEVITLPNLKLGQSWTTLKPYESATLNAPAKVQGNGTLEVTFS